MLMICGFYPPSSSRRRFLYFTMRIFNLTSIVMQLFFMYRFIWNNVSDMDKVSDNLCTSATETLLMCKLSNFMYHWKTMKKLEEDIKKKTSVLLTSEEEKFFRNSVIFGRRLVICFRVVVFISLFFFSVSPILAKKVNGTMELPVPMTLPFDPMVYFYEVCLVISLSILNTGWVHTNMDTIAITLFSFGFGQMEVLKCKIENIIQPGKNESDEIIQRKLYEFAEELNEIYRFVLTHFLFICLSFWTTVCD